MDHLAAACNGICGKNIQVCTIDISAAHSTIYRYTTYYVAPNNRVRLFVVLALSATCQRLICGALCPCVSNICLRRHFHLTPFLFYSFSLRHSPFGFRCNNAEFTRLLLTRCLLHWNCLIWRMI